MRKKLFSLPTRKQWEKLLQTARTTPWPDLQGRGAPGHLREIRNFGSNPGALRMLMHLPTSSGGKPGLVVVLHGCTQTAEGYDRGAGWSTLADRYGFAVLFPEQARSNNPNGCFNWFNPEDTQRDKGEALSIRQMVGKMIGDHGIDPTRVFVTGLSAGGAMTSVMLATYPEIFAGGAIVAGLPYGAARNVHQEFDTMFRCPRRAAHHWGDLVRKASPHVGPWPRVSIWHGSADATVIPSNADEIIKQWTDVHGVSANLSVHADVDGYPRRVWYNQVGEEIIESFTITNMGHGTPLATLNADGACGVAGPFLIEAGISSSHHIARFFGLAKGHQQTRFVAPSLEPVPSTSGTEETANKYSAALDGEILPPETPEQTYRPAFNMDIESVIRKAFRAAGIE